MKFNHVHICPTVRQVHCQLSITMVFLSRSSPYITEEMLLATFPRIPSKRHFWELWFRIDFNDTVLSAHLSDCFAELQEFYMIHYRYYLSLDATLIITGDRQHELDNSRSLHSISSLSYFKTGIHSWPTFTYFVVNLIVRLHRAPHNICVKFSGVSSP